MTAAQQPRSRGAGTTIVGGALLVAAGAAVGGIVGGVAALAGLGVARWRGTRAVAGAALVMLVVAALLTVLEAPASGQAVDYLFDFALDRPRAADAGLAAGVLAILGIVLATADERDRPRDAPTEDAAPAD